jgi:hypothetical protein
MCRGEREAGVPPIWRANPSRQRGLAAGFRSPACFHSADRERPRVGSPRLPSQSLPNFYGKRGSTGVFRGQKQRLSDQDISAGQTSSPLRPRQDSNLRTRFRKPMLYPLSYEGSRLSG